MGMSLLREGLCQDVNCLFMYCLGFRCYLSCNSDSLPSLRIYTAGSYAKMYFKTTGRNIAGKAVRREGILNPILTVLPPSRLKCFRPIWLPLYKHENGKQQPHY